MRWSPFEDTRRFYVALDKAIRAAYMIFTVVFMRRRVHYGNALMNDGKIFFYYSTSNISERPMVWEEVPLDLAKIMHQRLGEYITEADHYAKHGAFK